MNSEYDMSDFIFALAMALLMCLFLFLATGCKPVRQVTEKHYKLDSTIIKYEPLFIEIPGSEVVQELPPSFYDSISKLLAGRPPDQRVIYRTDPTLQTRLSFFLDSLGNLQAKCETLEKQYEDSIASILRIIKEIDHRTIVKEPGFFEKMKDFINTFALVIMLIVCVVVYFALK